MSPLSTGQPCPSPSPAHGGTGSPKHASPASWGGLRAGNPTPGLLERELQGQVDVGLGQAGGQLTAFSVCSLQDKWVLNHEDVLLGERIGRVSSECSGPCLCRVCERAGVALGHIVASWAGAPVSFGRVTLGRYSVAGCVLITPPLL